MNIYKISQTENQDYCTYDSAIVAAESEEEARNIHPSDKNFWIEYSLKEYLNYSVQDFWKEKANVWCENPNDVNVELLGKALKGTKKGLILASYNAGD